MIDQLWRDISRYLKRSLRKRLMTTRTEQFGGSTAFLIIFGAIFVFLISPIFTERHKTPWGAAINYDADGSEMVREFVIQNAIYWIAEFHLDGLRLDAVHAIKDDSDTHIVDELASRVRNAAQGRQVHLLLENEENEVGPLERSEGSPQFYTAQWNDDIHHVLHAAVTGETSRYYADYAGDTEKLGRALAEGFAFQGELMSFRGSPRGKSSGHLPPTAFVSFIQNHVSNLDQHHIARMAFDKRCNIAISRPTNQIAFPMARDRTIFDRRRSPTDGYGVLDLAEPVSFHGRVPGSANRAPRPQVLKKLLFQHAARLNEQAAIDRLV